MTPLANSEYRLVEMSGSVATEIERFDSAYDALSHLRSALLSGRPGAQSWLVVDPTGCVLAGADDALAA